jgi:hypothetical protein
MSGRKSILGWHHHHATGIASSDMVLPALTESVGSGGKIEDF